MRFSVVVPAHNEELLLPRGLAAIDAAARRVDGDVEVIVVANRCTDTTAAIASEAGAIVVEDASRNIAAVRNAGAVAATGEILVTIDADSVMDPVSFREIERVFAAGPCVGGGTKVVPERRSAGILADVRARGCRPVPVASRGRDVLVPALRLRSHRWVRRSRCSWAEDLDFARRLRAHGKRTGRRFTTMRAAPIVASCRKFDRYGDWHMFAMALQLREIRAVMKGSDTSWVDRYFFDFNE